MTADSFPASGYRLVLPPGWSRIPLRGGTDEALRQAIDAAVPRNPGTEEAARAKMRIRSSLQQAVADARLAGASDLYLPLQGMHGIAIPASFVVSELPATAMDAGLLRSSLLGQAGVTEVSLDDIDAIRQDEIGAIEKIGGQPLAPRRITYTVPMPSAGRVLVFIFTTLGDGDPGSAFSEVLVSLFDAILGTLRFERRTATAS